MLWPCWGKFDFIQTLLPHCTSISFVLKNVGLCWSRLITSFNICRTHSCTHPSMKITKTYKMLSNMELLEGYEENIDDCIEKESQIESNTSRKREAQSEKNGKASLLLLNICVLSVSTPSWRFVWLQYGGTRVTQRREPGSHSQFSCKLLKNVGMMLEPFWMASAQHCTTCFTCWSKCWSKCWDRFEWPPYNMFYMLEQMLEQMLGPFWMASAQHRTTWPNNVGWMLEQMLGPFERAFTWSENLLQMFIFFLVVYQQFWKSSCMFLLI